MALAHPEGGMQISASTVVLLAQEPGTQVTCLPDRCYILYVTMFERTGYNLRLCTNTLTLGRHSRPLMHFHFDPGFQIILHSVLLYFHRHYLPLRKIENHLRYHVTCIPCSCAFISINF